MALKETTQADYNQACAQCHKVGELDETVEGHRADGDCTSCHMRQGETSNIIHVNFTDHWIRTEADSVGVSFEEARDRHRGKAVVLEPFFDEVDSAAAVRQGVAYVMYWEAKHSHPAYLKEAVVALEAGLAKAPDHQEGQYFLGLAYRHLGRLPDSVERLRWAIALEPKDARAHFQFGRVLQEQEKDADAISAYQASLLANPLDAVAYNNLGNVFAKLGDSDRAIAAYKEAIRVRSDYATAYNNLGDQYAFRLDDFMTGKAYFEAALKYEPDFVMALHNLGTVLMGGGETKAAKGKFERVMELDGRFVPSMGNLVELYVQEGKQEEAREIVGRMEELLPGDSRVRELKRRVEALGN